jgi:hypothetical protein
MSTGQPARYAWFRKRPWNGRARANIRPLCAVIPDPAQAVGGLHDDDGGFAMPIDINQIARLRRLRALTALDGPRRSRPRPARLFGRALRRLPLAA